MAPHCGSLGPACASSAWQGLRRGVGPCCPHSPGSPSPEAFPDGMEVFGGLDSKDDAGDQEEGAPRQAEPEGILEQGVWG